MTAPSPLSGAALNVAIPHTLRSPCGCAECSRQREIDGLNRSLWEALGNCAHRVSNWYSSGPDGDRVTYCGSCRREPDVPRLATDPRDIASILEPEIERRGLARAYVQQLHALVMALADPDRLFTGFFDEWWLIRTATPEQCARAALNALEASRG